MRRVSRTEVCSGESLLWPDHPGPGPAGHSVLVTEKFSCIADFACMPMLGQVACSSFVVLGWALILARLWMITGLSPKPVGVSGFTHKRAVQSKESQCIKQVLSLQHVDAH